MEGLKDARQAAIGSYKCRCVGRERDIMVHWARIVGRLAVEEDAERSYSESLIGVTGTD